MKLRHLVFLTGIVSLIYFFVVAASGCAQIGAPTGGPRDSIPPVLVGADPAENTTNFRGNKIVLTFNEYIDVQDVQNNVLVSPFPKTNPIIDFKLKTVTVKLKDTLKPNTTYAINFGYAIRDNNEGNPFKNYTYVFSTGNTIDSMKASGKVIIAETGKIDTTLMVMLYRNVDDSAVQKRKPDYMAKLDNKGQFTFTNLSAGSYKIYALKDGDGGKTYNSKIEPFAFANNEIQVADSTSPTVLFAYAEEKDKRNTPTVAATKASAASDKKLRLTNNISSGTQDLLTDLIVTANHPLKTFDTQKITLTDTNYNKLNANISLDSTAKNIIVKVKWPENTQYRLIIDQSAIADSADLQIAKPDTIKFTTKKISDYGNLVLRFTDLNLSGHPVLQFVKGEEVYKSVPITAATWSDKLFVPGEYELRILYDANNNGVWDPGNYEEKLQPEKAVTLDSRLSIKANWDNERDIKLTPSE